MSRKNLVIQINNTELLTSIQICLTRIIRYDKSYISLY